MTVPPIQTCWCCPLCPQCALTLFHDDDGSVTCHHCGIRWEKEGQPGTKHPSGLTPYEKAWLTWKEGTTIQTTSESTFHHPHL